MPLGSFVTSACSFDDGTVLLNIAVLTGNALVTKRFGSDSFAYYPFPFPVDVNAPPFERSLDLVTMRRPRGCDCLAARKAADGLAVLARDGTSQRVQYIEHVRTRPYKPVNEIRDTSDLPIPFSMHASVSGDTAFVWFGGKTCNHRCIDLYRVPICATSRSESRDPPASACIIFQSRAIASCCWATMTASPPWPHSGCPSGRPSDGGARRLRRRSRRPLRDRSLAPPGAPRERQSRRASFAGCWTSHCRRRFAVRGRHPEFAMPRCTSSTPRNVPSAAWIARRCGAPP